MIDTFCLFSAARKCVFLDENQRQVLISLCDMAGFSDEDAAGKPRAWPAWTCHPGYEILAEFSGMGVRHAKRAVLVLEAMGVIRRVTRGNRSNVYHINYVWLETVAKEMTAVWRSAWRAQKRDQYEEVKRDIGVRLHTLGIEGEFMPGDWPAAKVPATDRQKHLQMIVARNVSTTHLKGLGLQAQGDVMSPLNVDKPPRRAVDKSGDGSPGVSSGHPEGDGGDTLRVTGATPKSSKEPQRNPSGPETPPPDAGGSPPDDRSGEGGQDPGSGGIADAPPKGPAPEARSLSGEGTGKLDRDSAGLTKALDVATVYWCAYGVWRPPSGRTLPIGPPPDDPGFLQSRAFLEFLLRDEIRPAQRGWHSSHSNGSVRAVGQELRQVLAGDHPDYPPAEAAARIQELEERLLSKEAEYKRNQGKVA